MFASPLYRSRNTGRLLVDLGPCDTPGDELPGYRRVLTESGTVTLVRETAMEPVRPKD